MVLLANLELLPMNPIEVGLIVTMSVLTLVAVVFAVRVLRQINAEETNPDSPPPPPEG